MMEVLKCFRGQKIENLVNFFKSKKVSTLCLLFFKYWYFLWILITVFSFLFLFYYRIHSGFAVIKHVILIHTSLFIESFVYYKIASNVIFVLSEEFKITSRWLENLSVYFFILFFLDIASMFSGGFHNSLEKSAVKFLEVLPVDSAFYSLYKKIYLYIPSIFDFIMPHMEGTSLLIIGISLAVASKRV